MDLDKFPSTLAECIEVFDKAWRSADDKVAAAAKAYWHAINLVGEDEARKAFDKRFGLGRYNLDLLRDIGAEMVDARVWFLPRYMHSIRKMDLMEQFRVLNSRTVGVYRYSSMKPKTCDIGQLNQSEWRVLFDREKNRLRNSFEQLDYIKAKKREFKNRAKWKPGSKKGTIVFPHGCSLTRSELMDILAGNW